LLKLIKNEALVLRRFRKGESSLIVHAFTRTHGRVVFIAKGARVGGKRAPVPLIPVVLLELVWSPSNKSEIQLLRETSLIDGFGSIHADFVKLTWAQAVIETLGRTLTGEIDHQQLFWDTVNYLHALEEHSERPFNLFQRFRIQALKELGFGLDFEIPLSAGATLYFDTSAGGVCTTDQSHSLTPVNLGIWKMMAALNRFSYPETQRLVINPEAQRKIEQILDLAYHHAFDHWQRLESLKLLDSLHSGLPAAEAESSGYNPAE